jgi:hypothetical protein
MAKMTNLELQALIVAINGSQSITPEQKKVLFDALSNSGNGKGLLVRMMEAIFGASWRTSLFAVFFFISGSAALIQQYVVDIGVPLKVSLTLALVFKLIGSLLAGDAKAISSSTTAGSSQIKGP